MEHRLFASWIGISYSGSQIPDKEKRSPAFLKQLYVVFNKHINIYKFIVKVIYSIYIYIDNQ